MMVSEQLINQARRMLESPNRFADDATLASLPSKSEQELDEMPFGVIQLSDDGIVLQYNQYECELSGRIKSAVLGQRFFIDVAPCTNQILSFGKCLRKLPIRSHRRYL